MNAITITLPLPDPALSPNARVHRWAEARAIKAYREYAWAVTKEAIGRRPDPLWEKATAQATFYFGTNRQRDKDNFKAMLKSVFDGMVDAGLMVNDSGLDHKRATFAVDPARPRVEITIEKVEI